MTKRMSPSVGSWLAQEDARLRSMIRQFGWSVQYVFGEEDRERASLAYTIGLFGMGHPELVFLGACQHTACGVLNNVGHRVKAGEQLRPGMVLTFDDWPHRVAVESVPNPGAILLAANRHYRRSKAAPVPALQLTHDDMAGRFPWDDGYSIPSWVQPRPGSYTA